MRACLIKINENKTTQTNTTHLACGRCSDLLRFHFHPFGRQGNEKWVKDVVDEVIKIKLPSMLTLTNKIKEMTMSCVRPEDRK